MRMLLRSLARNETTLATNEKLVSDNYIIDTTDVNDLEELTKFISINKRNIYEISRIS